jgi:multiple antibiotic resistance protein
MELIFATIAALLPIINPFSTAPLFLSLTQNDTDDYRNEQATKGVIYMLAILIVSLVGGSFIMSFFGLSLPGMRIAGGILVAGVGMNMLKPHDDNDNTTPDEQKEGVNKKDISFTPLAIPSLSGPGSISVVIGMSSLANGVSDYCYIALGIIFVACVALLVLRSATKLVTVLGVNGLHAMTKIMGFLILCVGIQFVIHGIMDILTGDEMFEFLKRVEQAV